MNKRYVIMVLIALVFASLAAMLAKQWIKNKSSSSDGVSNSIVVAAVDIPFGTKLDESHMKTIRWHSEDMPDGVFTKTEDVIGKIAKNTFYSGETITEQRVAEHLEGSALAALIAINLRAMTVRVDDVVGVAGFIQPGNKVDVLSTVMARVCNRQKAETITLLSNTKVLAVHQDVSPDKQKPTVVRAVTLELTPKQAEKIVAAMQEGKIQLTLRNPMENTEPDEENVILKPSVSIINWGAQSEIKCTSKVC
jgi:pilus assembly protein CpaB